MAGGDWDRDVATCSRSAGPGHDRARHAVIPLTAIQSEYSIMERMFETDVVPACAELGIGFVRSAH
jgi:aryl-alcohol dehydrogenase-like predicted oxidoreductase